MRSLIAVVPAAALVVLAAAPAAAAGNQPPVVVNDVLDLRSVAGIPFAVPALANDSDPDGDALTYLSVSSATQGTPSIQHGSLFYVPWVGSSGSDTFTYTVSDGQGNTATGSVTVTLWIDPPAPTDVTIGIPAPGSATLTWSAAARATGYRIYRNGLPVATTSGLTWTDNGLGNGYYSYRVAGVDGGGFVGPSSDFVVRGLQLPTPMDLTVDPGDASTTLALTWVNEGMFGVGPWRVYRDGAAVATTSVPEFEDTGLVTGRQYSYQVQLVGSSSTAWAYPPSPLSSVVPGTPRELTGIERLFRTLGGANGVLGRVTVAERAIPGGRQQDTLYGLLLQQDGEDAYTVRNGFATAYTSAGGAAGALGFPLDEQDCTLRDGGCGQFFEGGSIWSSSYTPTQVVRQRIEDGWAAAGYEEGPLGYPIGSEVALRGGVGQVFEDGAVYWTDATGSHGVSGPIRDRWALSGNEAGGLGYPVTDEIALTGGTGQVFQGGTIWASPSGGAHLISGVLKDAWARSGWENGPLGYPTSEELALRGGRGQVFQGGAAYWSPATGAHAVTGAIRDRWRQSGYENGGLGYPVTDEIVMPGGTGQVFQGGTIWASPSGGAHLVTGTLKDAWGRTGWEAGPLGYPTSEVVTLRGGVGQVFQTGAVYSSPTTGAHAVAGAIRTAWGATGAEAGALGYPVTDEIVMPGGTGQVFQGGTIWASPSGGAHLVTGTLKDAWGRTGWEAGPLGYPTTDQITLRGGVGQVFQTGAVYSSPATGAHAVAGAIRTAWGATGAENGPLGYPTTDLIALQGGTGQVFQGGTVYWSAAGGAHVVAGAIRTAWGARGAENGRLGYPIADETVSGSGRRQDFQGGTVTVDAAGVPTITYA